MLGRTIAGKYRIDAHLGSGSMGDVWRAKHLALDSPVALKIMRAELAKDEGFKERFQREAKAASRLSHANSVRVLDFGVEEDGLIYIAMELLEGRDLFTLVKEEFPLSDARIVHVMSQTLNVLAAAHALGIVHRDLKPENIMITSTSDEDGAPRDEVKVCDFGIAKLSDPATFKTQNDGRALTKSGTIMGTPEYMSPEQARGESLDSRSDLYSMGIVLYQMLVGQLPFTGDSVLTIVLKQVTDAPVPPSEIKKDVNLALENVCLRALRKDRGSRYQTAKEMRADIRAALRMSSDASGTYGNFDPPSDPHLSTPSGIAGIESAATIVSPPEAAPSVRSRTAFGTAASALLPTHSPPKWIYGLVAVGAFLAGTAVFALFLYKPQNGAGPRGNPTSLANDERAPPVDNAETPPLAPHRKGNIEPDPSRPTIAIASAKGKPAPSASAPSVVAGSAAPSASIVPPAASTPAASSYNPAGAFVALGALTASGVSRDPISKKMNAVLAQLSECYRDSLVGNGSPQAGSAQIQMSIDDTGRAVTVVIADKNAGFQRCAGRTFTGFSVPKTALTESTATATQWLKLNP